MLRQKSVCWSVTTCKPSSVWCHSAGSLSQRHAVTSIILLCSFLSRIIPHKCSSPTPRPVTAGHGCAYAEPKKGVNSVAIAVPIQGLCVAPSVRPKKRGGPDGPPQTHRMRKCLTWRRYPSRTSGQSCSWPRQPASCRPPPSRTWPPDPPPRPSSRTSG